MMRKPRALAKGDRIAIMRDGRFVQVGTPEEVVAAPADDYVANFVRDVPRSHVVAVGSVMTPPQRGDYAGTVPATTKVRDVVATVAATPLPVHVVDGDGTVIGVNPASATCSSAQPISLVSSSASRPLRQ